MIFRSRSNTVQPEPSEAVYFTPTHEPPLDQYRNRAELWWMGMNIYYLQADNLWLPAVCRIAGTWVDSRLVINWLDAARLAPVLFDAGKILTDAVERMGVEYERYTNGMNFTNITEDQMNDLRQLAERWHLGWCGSTFPIKRYFRKPLIMHGFTWTFGRK